MSNFFRKLRGSRGSPEVPPLRDTGERVIPERSNKGFARDNLIRQEAAHLHAIRRVRGSRRVLDVGCGTGYGCAMVAAHVGEVVGIDLSQRVAMTLTHMASLFGMGHS